MPTTVTIHGLDEFRAKLGHAPQTIRKELDDVTRASLLSLIPDLSDYPPPPEGSRYRRTGTLGRLWTAAQPQLTGLSQGVVGQIGNATPYAGYVQGGLHDVPSQAWMHKGRWQTTEQVVKKHETDIRERFAAALKRILAQL